MERETAASFLLFFSGVLVLALLSQRLGPQDATIGGISASDAGKKVSIQGKVVSESTSGNWKKLMLCNPKCIAVLASKNSDSLKGKRVTVTGTVQEYRGALEIIAEEVLA